VPGCAYLVERNTFAYIISNSFPFHRFLVNFGCDVNAQDSDGWTPLHCAGKLIKISINTDVYMT
jgi:hypothetical protein